MRVVGACVRGALGQAALHRVVWEGNSHAPNAPHPIPSYPMHSAGVFTPGEPDDCVLAAEKYLMKPRVKAAAAPLSPLFASTE